MTEAYKRTLSVEVGEIAEHTFEFNVIHQEDSLEFAVGRMYSPHKRAGSVRLQVVNGGTRSVSFERGSRPDFQKWVGVELDPDAEIVDAVVPASWHEGSDDDTDDEGSSEKTDSI